jgi:ABC-type enterochelin transport system substrate-binding protein
MQFTNLFVTLLLTTAVAAKGKNGTSSKAVTDKSLCKEMASLTKLVALASNETKLADKTNNNATKIAEIQAKASDASTQLTTMESNTTLVSTCAVIAAAQKTEDDCDQITSMTKLVALAANETKLADKAKNNATKIAEYQAKASAAAVKLQTLQANTTLTDACTSIASAKAAAKAEKGAGM